MEENIFNLIDFLYETAEKNKSNNIFKWGSEVTPDKGPVYNLSLSHGISSIIVFLSRILKSGITSAKVTEMLSGAVNYVLSQQIDFQKYGCLFSDYILKNNPNHFTKSRLAWCYGDLGIGLSVWQAGKVLNNPDWKQSGLDILIQSTHRRDLSENFVRDAGICHGSAGIAMIYRRMLLETNRDEFTDAMHYWINQTLEFSIFEDGLAGYKSIISGEWQQDYSLLLGISGIGLVLLSYVSGDKQDWDELLLLS